MTVRVEAYRRNPEKGPRERVTEGTFTYVHVDHDRRPINLTRRDRGQRVLERLG